LLGKLPTWAAVGRLQRILPPKMPFFRSSKSANFVKNIATNPEFITVTAVDLFHKVLPKQFEAFGFNVSQGKKQVTAEYWVSYYP